MLSKKSFAQDSYTFDGAKYSDLKVLEIAGTSKADDTNPVVIKDITDEIDLKLKMLNCHESQLVWMKEHDGIDFADMVKTCSKYRGYQCGATYAEGFFRLQAYID